ncbi:MAG: NTP transferase domain-containing protein [Crenarchaeota archaeon]|nr:NTP transferase domain-containing protein [Thermoproteota archaeon]
MEKTAIILASSISREFYSKKAILELEGKPLITYIIQSVEDIVEEIIVVTDSYEIAEAYSNFVPSGKFVVNINKNKNELSDVVTGLEAAQGEYSLVLPAGSLFVSPELITLLFDLCIGKNAVVPRWTNQECEPLHAVYNTKETLEIVNTVLSEGETDMSCAVERLRGVRYLSTMVIEQLDPDFKSFFTVTTPIALKKALTMAKPKTKRKVKTRKKNN